MALAVAACSGETTSPSPDGPAIDGPQVTAPVVLDEALTEAIEIREQYGLRANIDWVQAVAEHPDAVTHETWGIPLMPDELADVMSRRWPNSLVVQVRTYGLGFPDDFATAYINQKASGVAIEFTKNLDQHRAALAALPLDGPVEVRRAQWSLWDLERHLEEVKSERAWIESTGAEYVDPVIYELENRVVIGFEGPEGIEKLIEGHFGSPGWLLARWEGPGEWDGPRGELRIQVRDAAGRPRKHDPAARTRH